MVANDCPYRNQVQNRHKILYLFCTIYVPFHFRHKIGIPILYQSENLEILHVPFMCLCGLRLFCLYLFCAFQDLVIFSCAYFIPSSDLVIFSCAIYVLLKNLDFSACTLDLTILKNLDFSACILDLAIFRCTFFVPLHRLVIFFD